ncbi:hypothetical protein G6F55_001182 [Rhizopus delemar]|uniref:Zinc finger PHD-type domain-containing protein n=2 Tax=Rhizopus TaxID=4842 RepID=A0A9P6YZ31_9FUNG|nr:hypothetical protein G6F55_001182 [Rhizopus delemar]KAG1520434.1 hypothetical protein G6F52_007667 [Rhizopus delemar]KAG1537049.1 hypothetical protein G6F51_010608 [Rhizopus arrhizus]KAG1567351.1 hypothetical protein G6F50_008291 [Rhizopus delemar]KAG1637110.1 hypothetical protein G6F45_000786 [Rhizopus arrhizus]
MMKPYSQQGASHSIYRPAYYRIPSTGHLHKETSPEMMTSIVVPSMSNTISCAYYINRQLNYQPTMHHVPIHHTLENAIITYDTTIEHQQKDLVKDVFFSPAMNDREMSPSSASSTQSDDDEEEEEDHRSFSPIELLALEEENDLFNFGLEPLDKKPGLNQKTIKINQELSSAVDDVVSRKRRWFDSLLEHNKKQKLQELTMENNELDGYFEESDDEDLINHHSTLTLFEQDELSSVDSWEDKETKKDQKQSKKIDIIQPDPYQHTPKTKPRPTAQPTIYQKLTKANIDWCRYCGTTEGVNWRPGPWGKRTLCNKHGCDYKGYGFACKLPRLDLTQFTKESIDQRHRPVLQLYCSSCQRNESWQGNVLVRCEGCPKAYHQKCCPQELTDAFVLSTEPWFCTESCSENSRRKRILVELPRKRLPLMSAPSKSTLLENKRFSISK